MPIKDYSTTAANNTLTPPNGAPEGMAAGLVNNTIRQVMADTRSWYESGGWCDFNHVPTFVSTTSFTIPTDVTAFYTAGRRIRMYGPIMGTLYGFITASTYSAPNTTVTVALDSGVLTSNLSRVDLAFTEQEAQRLADNSVTTAKIANNAVTFSKLSAGAPFWDTNGNVGINTTSPSERLQVSGGNFSVLGSTSATFSGIAMQNNGASGSVYRGLFCDFRNENNIAVVNIIVDVNTDGSSSWALTTTPAGSRVSDRRVENLRVMADGRLQFNSGYGSNATAYGCRAWVNFNGTGTVTIRASGNVSSITDNGNGSYTINFTTAMPDANYSTLATSGRGVGDLQGNIINVTDGQTSGAFNILIKRRDDTQQDQAQVFCAVFR